MEHLPGTTLDGAAHQQHVPADIDAGQEPTFVKPVPESLFAHREALVPGYALSDIVAGGGLQKYVGSCDHIRFERPAVPRPGQGSFAAIPTPQALPEPFQFDRLDGPASRIDLFSADS
jgi:hypothetical protein